jgi:hypothetical protein
MKSDIETKKPPFRIFLEQARGSIALCEAAKGTALGRNSDIRQIAFGERSPVRLPL